MSIYHKFDVLFVVAFVKVVSDRVRYVFLFLGYKQRRTVLGESTTFLKQFVVQCSESSVSFGC